MAFFWTTTSACLDTGCTRGEGHGWSRTRNLWGARVPVGETPQVNLCWPVQKRTNLHVDALWAIHDMKSRSPEKFVNLRDVKVTDVEVVLSRCMTMKAISTDMKERIWINGVAIGVVSFPLHDDQSKQHEHALFVCTWSEMLDCSFTTTSWWRRPLMKRNGSKAFCSPYTMESAVGGSMRMAKLRWKLRS